jgi:hypothetical protein
MQYGAPEQANERERHGFDLSPVKSSASPVSQQDNTTASDTVDVRKVDIESKEGYDSDTKLYEMEELQAALKTSGLSLIGKYDGRDDGDDRQHVDPLNRGLVIDGVGEDITDMNVKSVSLLTLAQVQNVSSSALALGEAHSQKRDQQMYIQRDNEDNINPLENRLSLSKIQAIRETDSKVNDSKTETEIFYLSPVGSATEKAIFDFSKVGTAKKTTSNDPRGFNLSPALPFTPPVSPAASTKQVVDAEVEAIMADVKRVESELKNVVKSTKKKAQTKKRLAAKFNATNPRLSDTQQSRITRKEPGYMKSTISTDSRQTWKVGRSDNMPATSSHQSVLSSSHSLRQTQSLSMPRKVGSREIERRKGVETAGSVVGGLDAAQLAASVDSFASYLHQFVDQAPSIKAVSTNTCPIQEQTKPVDTQDSLTQQSELQQCDQCKTLQNELVNKETQWHKQTTSMKREHEDEMTTVKRELFVLQAKLRAVEKEGRLTVSVEGDHQLELERLRKEMKEQEGLIQGYQLENERLYKEVKDQQTKTKAVESQLFKENQKQATELVSVRSKLERCEQQLLSVGAVTGHQVSEGSAVLGAAHISQLEKQLQDARQREKETSDKLSECKEVNHMLEESLAALKIEMATSKDHLNQELSQQKAIVDASMQATEQRLENTRSCHEKEVTALKRQLKWYVENQELLDKDCEKMKGYEVELERLREEVKLLKCEGKEVIDRTRRKDKQRQADARRIQDLERQVSKC